jgi:hypothetical protein
MRVIIGRRVTESDYPDLVGKIGPGEAAVEVSEDAMLSIRLSSVEARLAELEVLLASLRRACT